ncbi:hypothetical protein DF051_18715 [Burkholderia contaminans]|uniref:Uncharacterized protein n=1 Tax=Burkholderia contaminans TaxID=488447 RepID=A0A3N8PRM7_9BURK|nr:hypothetical protein DF051_18715 [Burkholderia contaminans]
MRLIECISIYSINYIVGCIDFLNDAWLRRRGGLGEAGATGLRRGRSAFASGSVGFNISISVVAAPTGHHRTPTPKPDCLQQEGVRQPAKYVDQLTPNVNRGLTGAAPMKDIDGTARRLSDRTDSERSNSASCALSPLTVPIAL